MPGRVTDMTAAVGGVAAWFPRQIPKLTVRDQLLGARWGHACRAGGGAAGGF